MSEPEFGFYLCVRNGSVTLLSGGLLGCSRTKILKCVIPVEDDRTDIVRTSEWKMIVKSKEVTVSHSKVSWTFDIDDTATTYHRIFDNFDNVRYFVSGLVFCVLLVLGCISLAGCSQVYVDYFQRDLPHRHLTELKMGDKMFPGDCLISTVVSLCVTATTLKFVDGDTTILATSNYIKELVYQDDGNLVLYGDQAIWATGQCSWNTIIRPHLGGLLYITNGNVKQIYDIGVKPNIIGTQLLKRDSLKPGQYVGSSSLAYGIFPYKIGGDCIATFYRGGFHFVTDRSPICEAYIGTKDELTFDFAKRATDLTHIEVKDRKVIRWNGIEKK
jgi:hypothetical protein